MDALTRLIELQALYELKARRDLAIDTKDWALYASLHAEDYVAEHLGAEPVVGGRVVADLLRERLDGVTTIHHSHTPIIEFQDEVSATGIWAMEDSLFWKEHGAEQWLRGYGHYHERYVKRDAQWLFKSRRLDRLHVETSSAAASQRIDRSGESRLYRTG